MIARLTLTALINSFSHLFLRCVSGFVQLPPMVPKSGDQVNTSTQKRRQPSRPMRASRSSRSRPISSLPLPPPRALFRTPRAQYPEDIGDSTRCWPHRWTRSNPKFAHILLAALRAAPRGAFLLPSLRLCALQNPTPACQTPRSYLSCELGHPR